MRRIAQPPATALAAAEAAALLLLAPSIHALQPAPQDPPPEDPPAAAEAPSGLGIAGYLRTRFIGRSKPGENDSDLVTALVLDLGTAGRDKVTAHVHAYLGLDLDDESDPSFTSISDSYDDGVDGRLYLAYADLNDLEGLEHARIGRQQIYSTPVLVWFDGVGLETREFTDLSLSAGVYGGLPVRMFEDSRDGDSLLGAFVKSRPWERGRVRLDYTRFNDESELGDGNNDLWYLTVRQGVAEGLDLGVFYSWLDNYARDWRVSANGYDAEHDLTVSASYYELFEPQGHLALELDPLFSALLELYPYDQTSLLASKGVADWLVLEGGLDVRNVVSSADEGEFNRDFSRYYANAVLVDVLDDGVDLTVTADTYESDQTDIRTWGADLTKEMNERLDASIGSYYSLYKYELFLAQEREDVRTYYVRFDYDQTENLSFDLDYEYETGDSDNYQTLKVGLSWRF